MSEPFAASVRLDWEGFTVEIDRRIQPPVVRMTPHTSQSYPEEIELTDEQFTVIAEIFRLVSQ